MRCQIWKNALKMFYYAILIQNMFCQIVAIFQNEEFGFRLAIDNKRRFETYGRFAFGTMPILSLSSATAG
jgi:hypothetical protein